MKLSPMNNHLIVVMMNEDKFPAGFAEVTNLQQMKEATQFFDSPDDVLRSLLNIKEQEENSIGLSSDVLNNSSMREGQVNTYPVLGKRSHPAASQAPGDYYGKPSADQLQSSASHRPEPI